MPLYLPFNGVFAKNIRYNINELVSHKLKNTTFDSSYLISAPFSRFLFIQAAGLVYHHDAVVDIISPCGAVSHHALACIFPAA